MIKLWQTLIVSTAFLKKRRNYLFKNVNRSSSFLIFNDKKQPLNFKLDQEVIDCLVLLRPISSSTFRLAIRDNAHIFNEAYVQITCTYDK